MRAVNGSSPRPSGCEREAVAIVFCHPHNRGVDRFLILSAWSLSASLAHILTKGFLHFGGARDVLFFFLALSSAQIGSALRCVLLGLSVYRRAGDALLMHCLGQHVQTDGMAFAL